jgi:hypothetical protein
MERKVSFRFISNFSSSSLPSQNTWLWIIDVPRPLCLHAKNTFFYSLGLGRLDACSNTCWVSAGSLCRHGNRNRRARWCVWVRVEFFNRPKTSARAARVHTVLLPSASATVPTGYHTARHSVTLLFTHMGCGKRPLAGGCNVAERNPATRTCCRIKCIIDHILVSYKRCRVPGACFVCVPRVHTIYVRGGSHA